MFGLRALACLRRLTACERGNVAIVVALAMPVLIGGAALSVETSFDYRSQLQLQVAADAAAYSAGLQHAAGGNEASRLSAASTAAADNGWTASEGTIQLTSPAGYAGRGVEVALTENIPRFFTALFTATPIRAAARATAVYQDASAACVIALNKTKSEAVKVSGSASMSLVGCDVISNSVADDSVKVWGSSQITTECVVSAGGVNQNGGLHLTDCASPITQAPRVRDPLEALPTPAVPPGCKPAVKKDASLTAGHYCSGMNLSGNTTLAPGVYYVSGGDFNVNANASVSGSGVTIYLDGTARVKMNGNSQTTLSAPTSGAYAGTLFFGDRSNTGGSNKINGNNSSKLTGNLYFPTQGIEYLGNFSGNGGCTHIVADNVTWSGNATVQMDCSAYAMSPLPGRQAVRLVR